MKMLKIKLYSNMEGNHWEKNLIAILLLSFLSLSSIGETFVDRIPSSIAGRWKSSSFSKENWLQNHLKQDVLVEFGIEDWGGGTDPQHLRRNLLGYYCMDSAKKVVDIFEFNYDNVTGCLSIAKSKNEQIKFYCSTSNDMTLKLYTDSQRADEVLQLRKFELADYKELNRFTILDYPFYTRPMFNYITPEPYGSYNCELLNGLWELKLSYDNPGKSGITYYNHTYCDIATIRNSRYLTAVDFIDSTEGNSTVDQIKNLNILATNWDGSREEGGFKVYKNEDKKRFVNIHISDNVLEMSIAQKTEKSLGRNNTAYTTYIFLRKSSNNILNPAALFANSDRMKKVGQNIDNIELWNRTLTTISIGIYLIDKANSGANQRVKNYKRCTRCSGGGRLGEMNGDSPAMNGMYCSACGGKGEIEVP